MLQIAARVFFLATSIVLTVVAALDFLNCPNIGPALGFMGAAFIASIIIADEITSRIRRR